MKFHRQAVEETVAHLDNPRRIEVVSNTMGNQSVASMVVGRRPMKVADYRRFKIRRSSAPTILRACRKSWPGGMAIRNISPDRT